MIPKQDGRIVYLLPNPGLCPEVYGLPVLEGV